MSTTSLKNGASTSVEVLRASSGGLWVAVHGREYFLDFGHFPWFRRAPLDSVFTVELLGPDHLHWPELDVDLHLDSLVHPERYPLVARP